MTLFQIALKGHGFSHAAQDQIKQSGF